MPFQVILFQQAIDDKRMPRLSFDFKPNLM